MHPSREINEVVAIGIAHRSCVAQVHRVSVCRIRLHLEVVGTELQCTTRDVAKVDGRAVTVAALSVQMVPSST
jgi:hypothetical protein